MSVPCIFAGSSDCCVKLNRGEKKRKKMEKDAVVLGPSAKHHSILLQFRIRAALHVHRNMRLSQLLGAWPTWRPPKAYDQSMSKQSVSSAF
jgi:hypothetical protein